MKAALRRHQTRMLRVLDHIDQHLDEELDLERLSGIGAYSKFHPGGRCAVLRVVGHTHNLEPAALFLCRDWLPASGEEPAGFPMYCQRLRFLPEGPEHETVAELFLPLRPLSPPPPLP